MLRRVALVRTDVSEELSGLAHFVFIRSVRRLLVKVNVVPSYPFLVTLDGVAKFFRNVGSYESHKA
jgi:hypothetical protein